jgi:hypothetical protein
MAYQLIRRHVHAAHLVRIVNPRGMRGWVKSVSRGVGISAA